MIKISSFLIFTFLYVTTEELLLRNTSYRTNHWHRNITKRLVDTEDLIFHDTACLVGLFYKYQLFCSGSLVSVKYVLTAAQCTLQIDDLEKVRVIWKNRHIRDMFTNPHHSRKIVEIIIHPDFDPEDLAYDAAILRLNRGISSHGVAKLPKLQEDEVPPLRMAIIVGWQTSSKNEEYPIYLAVGIVIPILRQDSCYYIDPGVGDTYFCAGFVNREHPPACPEDAGSPLLIDGKQYGITSRGLRCGTTYLPVVFTSIRGIGSFVYNFANLKIP